MATVSGNVSPAVSFNFDPGTGFFGGNTTKVPLPISVAFTSGTTANTLDKVVGLKYTFTASTLQTLNLLTVLDPAGAAVNFARVNFIAWYVDTVVDGATLTFAPDGTNGWSNGPWGAGSYVQAASTSTNPAGGFAVHCAPNTTGWVVDSTHKVIDMTPSAHAFSAYLIIAGRSV